MTLATVVAWKTVTRGRLLVLILGILWLANIMNKFDKGHAVA